uniref:aquaporin-4-like n=1 Tax=Styela clava TaxID=7725 RepID=UPI0019399EAF|nr:aquaporin-4-like [Styela clava]
MDWEELKTKEFWVAIFAEFQATLLFVLIATGSAMSLNNSSYLHIALTFGLTIATLVQAIGHISGGHINSAVTVAMMVTRKISIFRGILYVIAQMVGAMCGSAILKGITPDDIEGNLAADMIMPGVSVGAGFGVEFLITWQFVMTVFATTDPNRKDLMGSPALAIGISIAIGHLFAIGYTNCGMNPARSFGPAVVSGFWTDHWVFWVGPILGGVLAALQYEFLLAPSASVQRFKNYVTCRDDKADGIINVNQVTNPVNVEMTTETNISTS